MQLTSALSISTAWSTLAAYSSSGVKGCSASAAVASPAAASRKPSVPCKQCPQCLHYTA